jgi:hypothetical protein
MILDKNKAFTFTIDKDEDAVQRSFRATKELMERIVEAENLALKNEIEANAVVINGRKYGMIKDYPGLTPTIFGMKVETRPDMPDEWDFFIQQRLEPQTNADRVRSMTDDALAALCSAPCPPDQTCGRNMCYPLPECVECWRKWLESAVDNG